MANNRVQVKRTSTTGRTPNTTASYATNSQYISAGELALNMTDGILYTSDGTNLIEIGANNTNQRITNSLTVNNDKNIRFVTVNTSAAVSFVQQSDDNFVMYSTNTAYGQRAIWSVYANSVSNLQIQVPLQLNAGLVANGGLGSAGQILASNGSTTYWVSPGAASVNTAAQFTWTNTHTFQANVTFSGNGIGISTNTGAIYLGGISDGNWKIGRNTGVVTKWRYTNNSIDIITANSNLEGFSIGLVNGNSYFETGYLGTFIAANVTIGNSASNSTINSTAFSGSANNTTYVNGKTESNLNVNNALTANDSSYLGGTAASGYQTTAGLSANVATLTANNTSFVGTVSAANVVSNAQLSGNLSNYQTTAGLSANVATLTSNNSTNLNGQPASYYTNASNITTGTLPWAQAPTGAVNTSGSFTLAGNTTLGGTNTTISSNLNVTGTFVNIGSVVLVNTTQITISGTPLSSNGSVGSAGQVLTSNGATGAPYWSTVTGGGGGGSVNTDAQYVWTNTHTFNANLTFGNSTFANTTVTSFSGFSNPKTLTSGVFQTNADLNTVLVGPYTVSDGNSLIITTGSRLVVI